MKYQITCNHCGTRFLVDGKGGQTIECTCQAVRERCA